MYVTNKYLSKLLNLLDKYIDFVFRLSNIVEGNFWFFYYCVWYTFIGGRLATQTHSRYRKSTDICRLFLQFSFEYEATLAY